MGETEVAYLDTERLCVHHVIAAFDCGQPEWNLKLRTYQERFERGEKVLGYVVVPGDSHEVLGYVVLSEDVFRERVSNRRIRCFTVPAMAVDRDQRRAGVFDALIRRALNVCVVRQQTAKAGGETPYHGIVCMPLGNKALERWLVGWAHFRPLGNGLYWIPLGNAAYDLS